MGLTIPTASSVPAYVPERSSCRRLPGSAARTAPLQLRRRRGNVAADERVLLLPASLASGRRRCARPPPDFQPASLELTPYSAFAAIWCVIGDGEGQNSEAGNLGIPSAADSCKTGKKDARAWAFTAQFDRCPQAHTYTYTELWKEIKL